MEKLEIIAGKHTPMVWFNLKENTFSISGSSLPENVHDFYRPILQWLDEYEKNIKAFKKPLKITVKFAYYNSGSMRYIAEIFKKMAIINKKGMETIVNWYYEKEDELLREAGEDLAELAGLDFNFIIS
jgi:hypothetical protein